MCSSRHGFRRVVSPSNRRRRDKRIILSLNQQGGYPNSVQEAERRLCRIVVRRVAEAERRRGDALVDVAHGAQPAEIRGRVAARPASAAAACAGRSGARRGGCPGARCGPRTRRDRAEWRPPHTEAISPRAPSPSSPASLSTTLPAQGKAHQANGRLPFRGELPQHRQQVAGQPGVVQRLAQVLGAPAGAHVEAVRRVARLRAPPADRLRM